MKAIYRMKYLSLWKPLKMIQTKEHKDTDNNHVHIVSTRVNTEGVRIDDAFERKRSLATIKQIMDGTLRQDMT
jgi:hypothetical protein